GAGYTLLPYTTLFRSSRGAAGWHSPGTQKLVANLCLAEQLIRYHCVLGVVIGPVDHGDDLDEEHGIAAELLMEDPGWPGSVLERSEEHTSELQSRGHL